jgi:hypothetical protein
MDDRTNPSLPPPPEAAELDANAPANRGRRGVVVAALILVTLIVLGGVAAGAAVFVLRGSPERLSMRVPHDADFFATAYLDPSASQKLQLERILRRFPAFGGASRIDQKVDGVLDGVLAPSGLTAADVRPWLGSQVGVAGRVGDAGTSFAVLVDSVDDEAAEAALADLRRVGPFAGDAYAWASTTRSGATLWVGRPRFGGDPLVLAVDDGTAIVGNSIEFASAVVSTPDDVPSLDEAAGFRAATASLPRDRLALAYVNVGSLLERLGAGGPGGILGPTPVAGSSVASVPDARAIQGLAMSLRAEAEGLALDITTTIDETKLTPEARALLERPRAAAMSPSGVLSWVPSDVYGVFATSTLREQIESGLGGGEAAGVPALQRLGLTGPDGVLANLTGELALEVGPGSSQYPTGALIIGTADAEGMRSFLDRVSGHLADLLAPSVDAAALSALDGMEGSENGLRRAGRLAARDERPRWTVAQYRGASIRSLQVPRQGEFELEPSYAVVDGVAILAASPEGIQRAIDAHAGRPIVDAAEYQASLRAIGDLREQYLYVDVDRIARAIADALPLEDRAAFERAAAPNLAPIDALVMSGGSTETGSSARVVLLIP